MHRALLLFQVNLRNTDISVGKCKQLPTLNSQEHRQPNCTECALQSVLCLVSFSASYLHLQSAKTGMEANYEADDNGHEFSLTQK